VSTLIVTRRSLREDRVDVSIEEIVQMDLAEPMRSASNLVDRVEFQENGWAKVLSDRPDGAPQGYLYSLSGSVARPPFEVKPGDDGLGFLLAFGHADQQPVTRHVPLKRGTHEVHVTFDGFYFRVPSLMVDKGKPIVFSHVLMVAPPAPAGKAGEGEVAA
jgi:hypothetical protein